MKKIAFLLLIAIAGLNSFAQTTEGGTTGPNYQSLENRLVKSDKTIVDEKKMNLAKTWIERARLLEDIADVNTQFLRVNSLKPIEAKIYFKEPKEDKSYSDGREEMVFDRITLTFIGGVLKYWDETNLIKENALDEAVKAFEKAKELDVEKKFTKKIVEGYKEIRGIYEKNAFSSYNKKDYANAHKNFAAFVDLGDKEEVKSVDTAYAYYAGLTAYVGKMYKEACVYFAKAEANNYKDPLLYTTLEACYYLSGDTAKGFEYLKKGLEKYPNNQDILVELINYYLSHGESDKALEYLEKAKEKDPTNKSYYFAEGTLFDKMGNTQKAIETYQKACQMDTMYFNSYYNLGVIYFNSGVKLTDIANSEMDNKKYAEKKKVADEEFKKVLPYMERAYYITSKAPASDNMEVAKANAENKRATLETLKTIYYRLKMNDKLDKVTKELKELQ
jgi:tetratricopeptide (TPR) repeat protein